MKKRAFLFLEFTRRCFEQPSVVRDHYLVLPLAASARTAVAPDSCGCCPVASLSWPSGSCPSVLLVAPAAYGCCNCRQEDLSAKSCSCPSDSDVPSVSVPPPLALAARVSCKLIPPEGCGGGKGELAIARLLCVFSRGRTCIL